MQKAKTDICNQQVVGSSPTNGSIKKSPVNNVLYADKAVMQKQSIASVNRDRDR